LSVTETSGASERNREVELNSSLAAGGLNPGPLSDPVVVDTVEGKPCDHSNGANESSISSLETKAPWDSVMAGLVVNETIDTYYDAVSEDQSQEGDVSNPLTCGASSSSPASEPQAAGSAGGSNTDMEGGNGPVDDGKRPQQHPNPLPENGLPSSHSSEDAVEGWHPAKSLQVRRFVQLTCELEAKEEKIQNFRALEKEKNVQLNQLQKENKKLLDQILHLERQHTAKSLQGGSYLDDSKAATPALLMTAINTVREIGKKFTKEFIDQLKKGP